MNVLTYLLTYLRDCFERTYLRRWNWGKRRRSAARPAEVDQAFRWRSSRRRPLHRRRCDSRVTSYSHGALTGNAALLLGYSQTRSRLFTSSLAVTIDISFVSGPESVKRAHAPSGSDLSLSTCFAEACFGRRTRYAAAPI